MSKENPHEHDYMLLSGEVNVSPNTMQHITIRCCRTCGKTDHLYRMAIKWEWVPVLNSYDHENEEPDE